MLEIIESYKDSLKELDKNKKTTFQLVPNKDWDAIDDTTQIIYCGDNPGVMEQEMNQYFVGKAGNEVATFINANNKRLGINDKKFAFFNKTPYHSKKTTDITKAKDLDGSVYQSIQLTIDCLLAIHQKNNAIPIVVFGTNESSYIVKSFKEILTNDKYESLRTKMTILNHPSHNSLFAEFGKYLISNLENNENTHISYSELIDKTKKNWF